MNNLGSIQVKHNWQNLWQKKKKVSNWSLVFESKNHGHRAVEVLEDLKAEN